MIFIMIIIIIMIVNVIWIFIIIFISGVLVLYLIIIMIIDMYKNIINYNIRKIRSDIQVDSYIVDIQFLVF